jgi:hypothetical protein
MIKQPKAGEREFRTLPTTEFRIATAEDGTRTLSGLVPYNSPSCDLGGFTELIAPSAFAGAFKAGADVLCLRDHIPANLLGRTKSKTLALTDSPEGLRFACKLPKTTQATDLAESVDRGDLDANSFGFCTIEDKWLCDAAGNVVRTLVAVDLYEISPCSFPAYPASQVSVRSAPTEIRTRLESGLATRAKRDVATPDNEQCGCACAGCAGGDCGLCSDADCDEEYCSCAESRSTRSADANRMLNIRLAFTD